MTAAADNTAKRALWVQYGFAALVVLGAPYRHVGVAKRFGADASTAALRSLIVDGSLTMVTGFAADEASGKVVEGLLMSASISRQGIVLTNPSPKRWLLSDLYLYLDETGQLGLSSSPYFGLGQAMFKGEMGSMTWEGTKLRFDLERNGVRLPKGFHAKNDRESTREKVFDLIAKHAPRFDFTLLRKKYLPEKSRQDIESDEIALYYLAWKKHFTYQATYLLRPSHRVFVVAESLSEHPKKQEAATKAIKDVLKAYPRLDITLCVWDNPTSWGLQVADYGLWAVQRDLMSGYCRHFKTISPLVASVYSPWEEGGTKKEYRPAAEYKKRGRAISTLLFNRQDQSLAEPREPFLGFHTEDSRADDEYEDEVPDDVFERDDPLGTGLWGRAVWSDDEPWTDELEGPWDDIRLRREHP